jgi:pilus assembly protein CpaE
VVETLSTQVLQRALRAGVRDVLDVEADTVQINEAIQQVGETLTVVSRPTSAPAAVGAPVDLGRVITVFSTKGGAGKSVLAVNLGVLLAQRSEKPVVLVDADLQFGDVAVMLKLTPQHTVIDAVANIHRLDATLLRSLLARHEPSGLYVLPAPVEPAFAEQVGADQMVEIVKVLQSFCSYVIIDTAAQFTDVMLNLLEMSDDILLMAGMDIPNIKNAKLGLQTLKLLNIPMEKLKLVMNRANSKVRLDLSEVERTLQMKAECLIPSDIVVPQSMNKGVPAVLDAPKSGVTQAIAALAEEYEPSDGRRRK